MKYLFADLLIILIGSLYVTAMSRAMDYCPEMYQIVLALFGYIIVGTFTGYRIVVMLFRIYDRVRSGQWIREI